MPTNQKPYKNLFLKDHSLHKRLKMTAFIKGKSIVVATEEAVTDWLRKHENKEVAS